LSQHSSEWPDTEVPNIKFDEQSLEAKSLQIRLHTTQVDINLIGRSSHSIHTALLSQRSIEENQILQSAVARGTGQCTSLHRENSTSRNLSIRHARDPRRKSSASEEHPKKSHSLS